MTTALHTVPGMGFKKNNPLPRAAANTGLEKVACRTKCGEVELKITLTPKFLVKPLREALVEPFLKVHNKRAAAPVGWEEIICIQIDGITLPEGAASETASENLLIHEEVRVELLTVVPPTLLDAFVAVARDAGEVTQENYRNPPPPPMTHKLIEIATAAGNVDGDSPPDADTLRRATNAFEAISGGGAAVSGARTRMALLTDQYVRELCFPESSAHTTVISDKIARMAVSAAEPGTVEAAEFTRFFAALTAAACAPPAAGEEEVTPMSAKKKKEQGGAEGFLQQLLEDDSVTARRIH